MGIQQVLSGGYGPPVEEGGGDPDADAAAFLTATSIVDATISDAINELVVDLKGFSIWTKMVALYPFVGGTSTTHKYNLKDPQDTDGAYRGTFSGTVTHDANGITGNGSTGYMNTHYNDSSVGTLNSVHMSVYSRTAGQLTNKTEIGVADASNLLDLRARSNTNFFETYCQTSAQDSVSNSDGLGLFVISRTASTGYRLQVRGTNTNKTRTSTARPSGNIYICCRNENGTPGSFSTRNIAFASIGSGLTEAEAGNLNTAVVTFQTALSRNV